MLIRNTVDVQSSSLDVEQLSLSMKSKTAGNYFMKRFIKCAKNAEFVSYYGLLFAALIEADSDSYAFTPRPFRLKVLGAPYVPDFMVAKKGSREIIDLAKDTNCATHQEAKQRFLENNRYSYSVITYSQLKKQQIKAESWLQIISLLVTSRHFSTTVEENQILERLALNDVHTIADIIDPGNRQGSLLYEVGLFRLLHAGCVTAALEHHPLNYTTSISLC